MYDLQTDPFETNNLADNPEFAAIRKSLGGKMDDWMKQQGDQGVPTEMMANTRQGKAGNEENHPKTGAKATDSSEKPAKKRKGKKANSTTPETEE